MGVTLDRPKITGMFLNLYPPGKAWHAPEGSEIFNLANTEAIEIARFCARVADLEVEKLPTKTTELLDEWESALGLPDPCVTQAQTVDERRTAVVAKLNAVGGQSIPYFESLIEASGSSNYRIRKNVINNAQPAELWGGFAGNLVNNTPWQYALNHYYLDIVAGTVDAEAITCLFDSVVYAFSRVQHNFLELPGFEGFEDNSWLLVPVDPAPYLFEAGGLIKGNWTIDAAPSGPVVFGKVDGSLDGLPETLPGQTQSSMLWIDSANLPAGTNHRQRLSTYQDQIDLMPGGPGQEVSGWFKIEGDGDSEQQVQLLSKCQDDFGTCYGLRCNIDFFAGARVVELFRIVATVETVLDSRAFPFIDLIDDSFRLMISIRNSGADNVVTVAWDDGSGLNIYLTVTETQPALFGDQYPPAITAGQLGTSIPNAVDAIYIDNVLLTRPIILPLP